MISWSGKKNLPLKSIGWRILNKSVRATMFLFTAATWAKATGAVFIARYARYCMNKTRVVFVREWGEQGEHSKSQKDRKNVVYGVIIIIKTFIRKYN